MPTAFLNTTRKAGEHSAKALMLHALPFINQSLRRNNLKPLKVSSTRHGVEKTKVEGSRTKNYTYLTMILECEEATAEEMAGFYFSEWFYKNEIQKRRLFDDKAR